MSENEPAGGLPEEIPFARAVSSAPPPTPVAPLYGSPAYAQAYGIPSNYMTGGAYASSSKPGVITTIGVLSIVIASVSIIGSGVAAMQALVQMVMVQSGAMVARSAAVQSAHAAATQLPPAGPDGLEFDERQTAINVMASRQTLNNARQAQLDELLSQGGQTILGVQSGKLTSNRARGAIQANSRGRSPRPGEPGPDIFVTNSGTIELYDANGVFRPADHAQSTIRVAADVNRYLATLNDATGAPASSTVTVSVGTSTTLPSAAPVATIDPSACAMAMSDAGLSFVIAVYLLVIGILTVRGNRLGGRLHLIFALIKIPLVAFGLFAWWRFQQSFAAAMTTALAAGGPPRSTPAAFGTMPIVVAILAGIYPVTLLILLMTSTVRGYYRKGAV